MESQLELGYICQDNNRSPQGMVGADASVSRQRRIVP